MNFSQVRQLVTDDFLSSLDSADLFTRDIIGYEYEFICVALRKEEDPESPILAWVKRGTRIMSWFARTYFSSVRVGEDSLSTFALEHNKIPSKFKVVDFEPSSDFYGNPFYSRRIVDMVKVREHLHNVYRVWSDSNATSIERGEANNELRANITKVVQDKYLLDGKITDEAENQFRLGRIIVEVTDWLEE